MEGNEKRMKFGLLRSGAYTEVSVLLNMDTDVAELKVGDQVVRAEQRPQFPLTMTPENLAPIESI